MKIHADLRHWVQLHADLQQADLLFVRLHEIIRENLHKLYPGMKVGPVTRVRLTRGAEVEEAGNANGSVLEQVRKRRYAPAVRLEFTGDADTAIRDMLRKQL